MGAEEYYSELRQWFFQLLPIAAVFVAVCLVAALILARRIPDRVRKVIAIATVIVVAMPAGFAVSLLIHNLAKPT